MIAKDLIKKLKSLSKEEQSLEVTYSDYYELNTVEDIEVDTEGKEKRLMLLPYKKEDKI